MTDLVRDRRRRTAGPLLAASIASAGLAVSGCAHALREAPSLTQVVGSAQGATPADVEGLLARGAAFYRAWDSASVRAAAEVWSRAAAADPSKVEGLLGVIRAMIWLTDHEPEPRAREEAAAKAVHAGQLCEKSAPGSAACSYWLGAALGVQARERPSTGLSALPRIEEAFKRAAAAQPTLEEGGPDRALALFYLRAPGWPTGPGDAELGLAHARRAAELRPDYPPNQLALGEALTATGEGEEGRIAYGRALELARRLPEEGTVGPGEGREWVLEAERAVGFRDR